MWQEVRAELHPSGLEVVTVALDVGGMADAGQWIEKANPAHPALIDAEHQMDSLFGVVNVPTGIWIDEEGTIVRGPEPAWPGRAVFADMFGWKRDGDGPPSGGYGPVGGDDPAPEGADPYVWEMLRETRKIRTSERRYLEALRDWTAGGASSRWALGPDEVIGRSRPRGRDEALGAAHFELAQHLWRDGHRDDAIAHFKEAHRLQPDNWTYRRQAWNFVSPLIQNAAEVFGSDWLSEVRRVGAENYYEIPPDMRD